MFKKIILGLIALLAVFVVVVLMQPDQFRVSRSVVIAAPASKIFPLVNSQKQWAQWSPWAKMDPNATFTYEGPDAGVGSRVKWSGNNDVGAGSSIVAESRPDEYVKFKLDFVKPMEGTSTSEFVLKPVEDKTSVTWTMYGRNNFIGKAVGLVMNCEKMVGEQFEKGLADLKAVAEKP